MGNATCAPPCCSVDTPNGVIVSKEVADMQGGLADEERTTDSATPRPVLTLTFILPDETVVDKDFHRKPLGMDFERGTPIVVTGVKQMSPGEEVGVEVGWIIKAINGEVITNEPFDYAHDILRKCCRVLREAV